MKQNKLLVVDDDMEMRGLLARFLSQEGFEVVPVPDGSMIDDQLIAGTSVVLLDLNLPGESGFDIARRIRKQCPTIGLIMLTGRGDLVDRVVGLELGADDYVLKPVELRELLARIRAVMRRVQAGRAQTERPAADPGAKETGQPIHFNGWTVLPGSRKVIAPCGREVNLTTTEFEILRTLSDRRGQTVTRQMLYEVVRGKDWSPLDRTLDTHMANLRKKLESTGGTGLIKSVHGQGYLLVVD